MVGVSRPGALVSPHAYGWLPVLRKGREGEGWVGGRGWCGVWGGNDYMPRMQHASSTLFAHTKAGRTFAFFFFLFPRFQTRREKVHYFNRGRDSKRNFSNAVIFDFDGYIHVFVCICGDEPSPSHTKPTTRGSRLKYYNATQHRPGRSGHIP